MTSCLVSRITMVIRFVLRPSMRIGCGSRFTNRGMAALSAIGVVNHLSSGRDGSCRCGGPTSGRASAGATCRPLASSAPVAEPARRKVLLRIADHPLT